MARPLSPPQARASRPLVIAHRGASGAAPENTCAAIRAAIDLGADMIEVDLQLTKDGRLVVFHDWTLARTIRCEQHTRRTLRRLRICDLSLEEITGLDAGRWWNTGFTGERVPTLENVLALCGRVVALNLEIKPRRLVSERERRRRLPESPANESAVIAAQLQAALAAHPGANLIVSSFDHALLARLQRTLPDVRLGVLTASRGIPAAMTVAGMLKAYSLHVPCISATRRLADAAHTAGLRLFAYTANRKVTMRRLLTVGVDGIFTNFPDRLLRLLER